MKVIDFYIPDGFHKRVKWIPEGQRGKVIEIETLRKMPEPNVTSELSLGEPSRGFVKDSKGAAMELTGVVPLPFSSFLTSGERPSSFAPMLNVPDEWLIRMCSGFAWYAAEKDPR